MIITPYDLLFPASSTGSSSFTAGTLSSQRPPKAGSPKGDILPKYEKILREQEKDREDTFEEDMKLCDSIFDHIKADAPDRTQARSALFQKINEDLHSILTEDTRRYAETFVTSAHLHNCNDKHRTAQFSLTYHTYLLRFNDEQSRTLKQFILADESEWKHFKMLQGTVENLLHTYCDHLRALMGRHESAFLAALAEYAKWVSTKSHAGCHDHRPEVGDEFDRVEDRWPGPPTIIQPDFNYFNVTEVQPQVGEAKHPMRYEPQMVCIVFDMQTLTGTKNYLHAQICPPSPTTHDMSFVNILLVTSQQLREPRLPILFSVHELLTPIRQRNLHLILLGPPPIQDILQSDAFALVRLLL